MAHLAAVAQSRQPLATANLGGMQDRWEAPPEVGEDERDPEQGADVAIEIIGRACRALPRNKDAAADLLREAAKLLACIADEVTA